MAEIAYARRDLARATVPVIFWVALAMCVWLMLGLLLLTRDLMPIIGGLAASLLVASLKAALPMPRTIFGTASHELGKLDATWPWRDTGTVEEAAERVIQANTLGAQDRAQQPARAKRHGSQVSSGPVRRRRLLSPGPSQA